MININYYGVLYGTVGAHGVKIEALRKTDAKKIIDNIHNRTVSSELGFLDLPNIMPERIQEIQRIGAQIASEFKNFVLFGVGGSSLTTKAVFSALTKKTNINCYVFDNIDPDTFVENIRGMDIKKTAFFIASKSGTTLETIAQMTFVINMYSKIKFDYSKNIFVATEKNSALAKFANAHNIKVFDVESNMNSRFAGLTNIGLLPAAVYGADIAKLLQGAKNMLKVSQAVDIFKNLPLLFAKIATSLYAAGKNQIVLFVYGKSMLGAVDYFNQFWAESLSKTVTRDGRDITFSQTPIKTIGSTDQHSQLQLFVEGGNDKIITFINVKNAACDDILDAKASIKPNLEGKTFKQIMEIERLSTAYALTMKQRPNLTITLSDASEETLGEFLMFTQMATAYAGEILNINAFNQPGIEDGKIFTNALLNKDGSDAYNEMLAYIEKLKKNEV